MNYIAHLLIYFSIYAILAMSLNLVTGYCGLISLAHAAYFAIGAYAYALGTITLGIGFIPAMLLGITVACLLSLAVSVPAWRFKGDFFILVSLVVQALVFGALFNWRSSASELGTWANLTNGPFGISGIPRPVIAGYAFDTMGSMCVLSLAIAAGCGVVCWLLVRSPWGRLLKAMRDDELAAKGLGKNTRLAKVHAFAFACGLAAVAGAIYASYVRYIDPSSASFDESILMLCMVLVGGLGNFRGPIVGAAVLLAIPEALRFASIPDSLAPDIRLMAYGLLLILMAHFRPQGLAGVYRLE